jgi:hypothetical protein
MNESQKYRLEILNLPPAFRNALKNLARKRGQFEVTRPLLDGRAARAEDLLA